MAIHGSRRRPRTSSPTPSPSTAPMATRSIAACRRTTVRPMALAVGAAPGAASHAQLVALDLIPCIDTAGLVTGGLATVSAYAPMALCGIPADQGQTGGYPGLGIMTGWQAQYLTRGAPKSSFPTRPKPPARSRRTAATPSEVRRSTSSTTTRAPTNTAPTRARPTSRAAPTQTAPTKAMSSLGCTLPSC